MPKVEAYRCRFTDEVFTSRIEFKNHLLDLRDDQRQQRANRRTNVDPGHLQALFSQMRALDSFDEISEFVLDHGKEFGYHFASKTRYFKHLIDHGVKIQDWPVVTCFSFAWTEYKPNMKLEEGMIHRGWTPILLVTIANCEPRPHENIFEGTGIVLNRMRSEGTMYDVIMFADTWPGLMGTAALEILSAPMAA